MAFPGHRAGLFRPATDRMPHGFFPRRPGVPILLLTGCLALPTVPVPTASAGESADDLPIDPARPLETVVVTATRKEESILDTPEAISAIDAEEISRLGPDTLAEILRSVPGAFFQQTTPGQGIPIIRGLKGSQVLHLVDGMRLNNAFFRNAPNQYLGLVDAYAAARTEVVRGSAPSLYGADAMGGVVQVLTREPDFDGTDWSADGRLYGSFDSVDSGLVTRLEGAAGHRDAALSGGFTYEDHGNRSVGDGGTVRPTAYEVRAADLKWRQSVADRNEFMLSAQYLEQPRSPRVDELVPGYGQDQPGSERYWFQPNSRRFLHARFRHESDSRWFRQLEAHLGRQVITDDRLTRNFGASEYLREFNESALNGFTVQINSPWSMGGPDAELVWGFEYYADDVSSRRYAMEATGGDRRAVRSRFPDGSTMDSTSVYASNRWDWGRFRLDAGLRYSRFEIRLPPDSELEAVRLTPSDLTGDVHLLYELGDGVHLVGNVGRGFRPPNIFDLGTLGSRPGNRFNIPNPDLGPETVWSYDAGIKAAKGRWQAEAFVWYSDYRDKISSRFTGDISPEGRQIVQSDNLNEARLYGLESGLRYLAGDSLELYAVLNYTRGEESDAGVTVPADRVPPLNGRLGLVFHHGSHWRIEPFLDFAGRQNRLSLRDVDDPRINPNGTAGFATVNLLVSWQASPVLTAGLRLENLADRNYREHGSGIDAPGRNLGAWLDYRF
jgi:outer membrane receptor protein involved in Fe transport